MIRAYVLLQAPANISPARYLMSPQANDIILFSIYYNLIITGYRAPRGQQHVFDTHMTRQSSLKASNKRKQYTQKLKYLCTCIQLDYDFETYHILCLNRIMCSKGIQKQLILSFVLGRTFYDVACVSSMFDSCFF